MTRVMIIGIIDSMILSSIYKSIINGYILLGAEIAPISCAIYYTILKRKILLLILLYQQNNILINMNDFQNDSPVKYIQINLYLLQR